MKNLILPLLLAVSLTLTAQFSSNISRTVPSSIIEKVSLEALIENLPDTYAGEEENNIALAFEIEAYLPANFNPYKGLIIDESSALISEEIAFDFDINEYLPKNFDVYVQMIEDIEIETEEIPFDFIIEDYLPAGFNPNQKVTKKSM